jgi:hypothetical protein
MFIAIARFFDRLEDRVRNRLSHRSIIYAFVGGAAHVIFWRGIWITCDKIRDYGWSGIWANSNVRGFWGWFFYEPVALIWATGILLLTGLFVSGFIGERIIISGLKKEKKVTDRTEEEVQKEENKMNILSTKVDLLMNELRDIKNELVKK